jgi:hypothetical protein
VVDDHEFKKKVKDEKSASTTLGLLDQLCLRKYHLTVCPIAIAISLKTLLRNVD